MPYHVLKHNDNVFSFLVCTVYALRNEGHRLLQRSSADRRSRTVNGQNLDYMQAAEHSLEVVKLQPELFASLEVI